MSYINNSLKIDNQFFKKNKNQIKYYNNLAKN